MKKESTQGPEDLLLRQRIRELSPPLEPLPTEAPLRLVPLDGIETVLFDIYGTLLISASGDVGTVAAGDHGEALAEALACAGFSGDLVRAGEQGADMLREEIQREHVTAKELGVDVPEVEIRDLWRRVVSALGVQNWLQTPVNECRIERLAIEYECRVNPVCLMPGARWTLKFILQRGLRLGIVSNAQFYTPLILETLLEKSLDDAGFDPELVVWSFEKRCAKPSAALFAGLPIRPESTLYAGNDLLNDAWTASQAGCRTVLFAGDRRSLRLRENDPRCRGLQPDAVIDDLRQLTELL